MERNPATESWFQINRILVIGRDEAIVQWVETDVDLTIRWPWLECVICSTQSALLISEMTSTRFRYHQVQNLVAGIETREDFFDNDLTLLTTAPTRFYHHLQGRGGWW